MRAYACQYCTTLTGMLLYVLTAGVVSNAFALAKIAALLANQGDLDGVRLLRPDTWRKVHTVAVSGFDGVIGRPMQWAVGVRPKLRYA